MAKIKHIGSGNVFEVSNNPVFMSGVWECGGQRFMDKTGTAYVPVAIPAKVSVIEFKLLFSNEERVAIANARSTNHLIDDFYALLDDPRTQNVDMSLPVVQAMLDYLIEQGFLSSGRKDQILSYTP